MCLCCSFPSPPSIIQRPFTRLFSLSLSLSASHLVPPSLHVCVATAVIIIIGDVGCVACMMHGDVKGQTHNILLFV